MTSSTFVVNASPLIFLSRIDALSLLRDLAESVIVPDAVLQEYRAGQALDPHVIDIATLEWLSVRPDLLVPDEIQRWDLGAGESQVLAHAAGIRACEALLDDRQARRCAASQGILTTGTLGVILRARRANLIPAARPLLERLRRTGMYLAPQLMDAALDLVGE